MNLEDWIGKTDSSDDIISAAPVAALSATLDRMYAGGRVDVQRPLRIGDEIQRVSRIVDVSEKSGRSGPLVFVKVRHEISGREGVALIEDHDIVYRDVAGRSQDRPLPEKSQDRARLIPNARVDDEHARNPVGNTSVGNTSVGDALQSVPLWRREIVPDEVLLFRYSALTFNAYRIHYDRRFAVDVQGYSGLVVHAPLVATLLADLLRRNLPKADVSSFSSRALRPLFDGQPIHLCGRPERDGVEVWALGPDGERAFEATAQIGFV